MNEAQVEKVVSRLQAGEPVEAILHDFPQFESEVRSYAHMHKQFSAFRAQTPAEEGLQQVLRAMPQPNVQKSTPSPFVFARVSEASLMYRSAFALPLLLLVILASGVYFWPHNGNTPTTAETPPQSAGETAVVSPTSMAMNAESASGARSAKTMSLSAVAPVTPPLPADSSLAAIYGPELTHDAQAVSEDSVQVQNASDDTAAVEGYTNAYDEQAF